MIPTLALGGLMLIVGAGAALAQAPNPQAIIEQTATFYLHQGVLGATCVFLFGLFLGACWVIRSLYGDVKAQNAAALAERNQIILAQTAAATAADKVVAALEGLRAALETGKDASEDLTKQVELTAQETRHSLANILAAINGLASRADRGRP